MRRFTLPEAPHPEKRPPAGALARWENEGGKTDTGCDKRAALGKEEELILHCLGGGGGHDGLECSAHESPARAVRESSFGQRAAPQKRAARANRALPSPPQGLVTVSGAVKGKATGGGAPRRPLFSFRRAKRLQSPKCTISSNPQVAGSNPAGLTNMLVVRIVARSWLSTPR